MERSFLVICILSTQKAIKPEHSSRWLMAKYSSFFTGNYVVSRGFTFAELDWWLMANAMSRNMTKVPMSFYSCKKAIHKKQATYIDLQVRSVPNVLPKWLIPRISITEWNYICFCASHVKLRLCKSMSKKIEPDQKKTVWSSIWNNYLGISDLPD